MQQPETPPPVIDLAVTELRFDGKKKTIAAIESYLRYFQEMDLSPPEIITLRDNQLRIIRRAAGSPDAAVYFNGITVRGA